MGAQEAHLGSVCVGAALLGSGCSGEEGGGGREGKEPRNPFEVGRDLLIKLCVQLCGS